VVGDKTAKITITKFQLHHYTVTMVLLTVYNGEEVGIVETFFHTIMQKCWLNILRFFDIAGEKENQQEAQLPLRNRASATYFFCS